MNDEIELIFKYIEKKGFKLKEVHIESDSYYFIKGKKIIGVKCPN